VLFGEDHPESHFNLALVCERRGLLADAEREMLASLRLNPRQPDARNSLGVISAEEGKTARAVLVWHELVCETPDCEPARKNLRLLGSRVEVARGETAAAAPRRPPSKLPKSSETDTRRHPKYSRDLRNQVESNHGWTSSN
jgi:Flp pilus assembly protein TadD